MPKSRSRTAAAYPWIKASSGEVVRLPVTERVAAALVRLPLFPDLTDEEQGRVIAAVLDLLE